MKGKMFFLLAIILAITAAANLSAQSIWSMLNTVFKAEPVDFIESPASFATRGRFGTDADDFISAAYYKDTDLSKWYGYGSYAFSNSASIGYAKYFNNVYVGLYYGGNLWASFPTISYTESSSSWAGGPTQIVRSYAIPDYWGNANRNDNRLAVLIGVGDMGFRFSYASNYSRFSKDDFRGNIPLWDGGNTGNQDIKSYKSARGWIIPQFQWGITRPLADKGIQPTITFDLGFYRDYQRFNVYDASSSYDPTGDIVNASFNFMQPQLSFGLGGYNIKSGDSFRVDMDLDYSFGLHLFKNDYSYYDSAGNVKIKSIKGISLLNNLPPNPLDPDDWTLAETRISSNEITPSIGISYTGSERLGLGAKLSVPMSLGTMRIKAYEIKDTNGNLQQDGPDGRALIFSFRPVLELGLQYQAIPGKLIFNLGGRIETAELMITRVKMDIYTAGVKVSNSETKSGDMEFISNATNTSNGRSSGSGLYAGLCFYFSKHFGLDSVLAVEADPKINTDGRTSYFLFGSGPGSLTSFYSIMVNFKF